MAVTTNKGYALQTTGTNVGIWGTVLNNSVFSIIDSNLGATLPISVAGNSNINLTSAQAQNLIHTLTGALTGNIQYIFPAAGGFYLINNQTTGAYTVTIAMVGGTGTVLAQQGVQTMIFVDAVGLNVYPAAIGIINSGSLGQLAYYGANGTTVSGDANATVSAGTLTMGQAGSVQGSLVLAGSTSGITTIAAPVAGTGTMTLHAGTDTLLGAATTDTLTNKTFDTAGTGNAFKINGAAITAISGNTAKVATTTGTLTSGHVATFDASGNINDGGTAPVSLNSPAFTGVPTAPTATSGTATTQLATTAFANPGTSLATNGYRKNSDGTIEQWGQTSASFSTPVSFPIAFPNACFAVTFNPIGSAATGDAGYLSMNSAPTTTGFSPTRSSIAINWRAIGY